MCIETGLVTWTTQILHNFFHKHVNVEFTTGISVQKVISDPSVTLITLMNPMTSLFPASERPFFGRCSISRLEALIWQSLLPVLFSRSRFHHRNEASSAGKPKARQEISCLKSKGCTMRLQILVQPLTAWILLQIEISWLYRWMIKCLDSTLFDEWFCWAQYSNIVRTNKQSALLSLSNHAN